MSLFFCGLFLSFFFCLGKKRFDGVFIYFVGQKNNRRPKSGGFRERKKKLDSLFFTRFIKPLPPVLVFKKDDDFDDDNALSSV